MTLPISNRILPLHLFQPHVNDTSISLTTIKKTEGDINQIITLLNQNKENCLELFRKAIQEGDSIAQIQLSQAYCGIKYREEESKQIPPIKNEDLDEFNYYPKEFYLFKETYCEALQCEYDYKMDSEIAGKTFRDAANKGYLPAFLEYMHKIWGNHTKSYGFAVQLQPFVNKGNKVIDYYFGRALKHGAKPGSKLFYEGLYWIHRSDGLPVQFPQKNESFNDFTYRYYRSEGRFYSYYSQDGFIYAKEGPAILAPSREKWNAFIKEKVENAEITSEESYTFEYDEKRITSLLTKNIGTVCSERFEHASTGPEIAHDYEKKIPGFSIQSLSLYDGGTHLGTISVRKSPLTCNKHPFEICKTIKSEKMQPIIEFIENIMIRTGSPSSASSWLSHLKDKQYLFPSH